MAKRWMTLQAKDLLRYINSHDMSRNEKIKLLCILCGVDESGNADPHLSMGAKEFRAFLQDQDDRYVLRTNKT